MTAPFLTSCHKNFRDKYPKLHAIKKNILCHMWQHLEKLCPDQGKEMRSIDSDYCEEDTHFPQHVMTINLEAVDHNDGKNMKRGVQVVSILDTYGDSVARYAVMFAGLYVVHGVHGTVCCGTNGQV